MSSTSVARPTARTMLWQLEGGGCTPREAANLVGLAHGLKPTRDGWTVREIEHLRFLRAVVTTGRISR